MPKFYIQRPMDHHGNTGQPRSVIEVEEAIDESGRNTLIIKAPVEMARDWCTADPNLWKEMRHYQGPAKYLDREEEKKLWDLEGIKLPSPPQASERERSILHQYNKFLYTLNSEQSGQTGTPATDPSSPNSNSSKERENLFALFNSITTNKNTTVNKQAQTSPTVSIPQFTKEETTALLANKEAVATVLNIPIECIKQIKGPDTFGDVDITFEKDLLAKHSILIDTLSSQLRKQEVTCGCFEGLNETYMKTPPRLSFYITTSLPPFLALIKNAEMKMAELSRKPTLSC